MKDAQPDWVAWHERYDDPRSWLHQRLAIVQRLIVDALDRTERSPFRVISMCAGQARDLTGAVERSARRDLVGRLVEMDPAVADGARAGLSRLGATGLEVVTADAGETSVYAGAVPADLVLACGVFGNVSNADVEATIRALPELCATGGTFIWTRQRRPPDLNVEIRRWLAELDFETIAFEAIDEPRRMPGVGAAVYRGSTRPLQSRRLFAFDDDIVMRRHRSWSRLGRWRSLIRR